MIVDCPASGTSSYSSPLGGLISFNDGNLTHGNPFKRAKDAGIDYCFAENIAEGQENVQEVMRSWMSRGHHKNIIGNYDVVGFGMAEKNGRKFWCVDFGKKNTK